VIGGGVIDHETAETARAVGRELGNRGHTVVCGGHGGVMEAVCEGARAVGGHTIGVVSTPDYEAANEFVDTAIATDMGNARNVLVVLNGDATIAIDGSTGTLSEIGHALDFGRSVAGIDTHDIEGVEAVDSATAAVDYVESAVESQ
jgi:uncharacterized protein (TIGR00725 family)